MSYRHDYGMDVVRAALMLLGVPYHVARLYAQNHGYGVESPDPSLTLGIVAAFLHSFRMAAFFLIAGYFAAMVMLRSTPQRFLASRAIRIGVPLVCCTLLFPLAGGALVAAAARPGGPVSAAAAARLLPPQSSWWVMHLWFLQTLLVLTLLLAGAALLVRHTSWAAALAARLAAGLTALTRRRFLVGGTLLALAMVAVWMIPNGVKRLTGVPLNPFGALFDLRHVVRYLPMFALGAALWLRADVRQWFCRRELLALPVALAASAVFVAGDLWPHRVYPLVALGAGFAGMFWAQVMVSFAARKLDQPRPPVSWLAQASYTVYLVHFPIVLLLGLLFVPLHTPPLLEFGLLTALALGLSLGFDAIVRRSRWLRFIFNGRPPVPAKAPAGADVQASGGSSPMRSRTR